MGVKGKEERREKRRPRMGLKWGEPGRCVGFKERPTLSGPWEHRAAKAFGDTRGPWFCEVTGCLCSGPISSHLSLAQSPKPSLSPPTRISSKLLYLPFT